MKEIAFQKVDRANLSMAAIASLVSIFWLSSHVTFGVAAGAGLMALNFYVLRRLALLIFGGGGIKVMIATVLLGVKLALFLGAGFLLLKYLPVNIVAFGLGALAVVLTTLVATGRVAHQLSA